MSILFIRISKDNFQSLNNNYSEKKKENYFKSLLRQNKQTTEIKKYVEKTNLAKQRKRKEEGNIKKTPSNSA